jgi:hypothetical protein
VLLRGKRHELFMPETHALRLGERGHRANDGNLAFRDFVDLPHQPNELTNAHQLFGKRGLWKQMRRDALEAAQHRCEVCSFAPSPIYGDPLTCHEVWHYDDKHWIATLTGLKIHCSKCDSAVHMGIASVYGAHDAAIAQLCRVNRIGPQAAEELFAAAMTLWKKGSKKKWRIAVAKPLLKRYPQLLALETK